MALPGGELSESKPTGENFEGGWSEEVGSFEGVSPEEAGSSSFSGFGVDNSGGDAV